MELVATQLYAGLESQWKETFECSLLRPSFQKRFGFLPSMADRLANRFWNYPQHLKNNSKGFDLYHIADHSYAHLVHELPNERCGVYCHDIDAFRSSKFYWKPFAQRIASGLRKAAIVFYSTESVRKDILHHHLIDESKLIFAPYGVSEEFNADTVTEISQQKPFLLHVSSCIPRKRVDVLLNVFAEISKMHPELRLVQVGGKWTNEQLSLIDSLGISQKLEQVSGLPRKQLAALYQNSELVLLPSESEGFGLPVIEALACGARVVASDISVLREIGNHALTYCPVADVKTWSQTVSSLLLNKDAGPDRSTRFNQASRYTWSKHCSVIANAYQALASRPRK